MTDETDSEVAAEDLSLEELADIIAGELSLGASPHVKVFSGIIAV